MFARCVLVLRLFRLTAYLLLFDTFSMLRPGIIKKRLASHEMFRLALLRPLVLAGCQSVRLDDLNR